MHSMCLDLRYSALDDAEKAELNKRALVNDLDAYFRSDPDRWEEIRPGVWRDKKPPAENMEAHQPPDAGTKANE